jgi:hypothetical protein
MTMPWMKANAARARSGLPEAFLLGQDHAATRARGDREAVLGVEDSRYAEPAPPAQALPGDRVEHGRAQRDAAGADRLHPHHQPAARPGRAFGADDERIPLRIGREVGLG